MSSRDLLIYLSILYNGNWGKIYDSIKQKEETISDEVVNEALKTIKCNVVTLLDPEYPDFLRHLVMPPFVLYYYGDLSLIYDFDQNISVVGSRKNTKYGAEMTYEIVKGLAKEHVIISGMAKGIDSVAHKACIDAGGKTVAVLGCGIDYCYPLENINLYKEIKENHLLISEYPNNVEPKPTMFPERNRIIAGFANTILVGEASVHSGTFITVADGLMNNRNICCIPHPANVNSGCNRLIKEGAVLVETAQDVIDEMPPQRLKK